MRQWTVGSGDSDRRFSRYLQKKLPGAPSSFLHKMLRKKNITLNGKKASGSELLHGGDLVTFFLSDETIRGFGGTIPGDGPAAKADPHLLEEYVKAYRQLNGRIGESAVLYESADILAVKKPVGILSQKAADTDRSMNEWFAGYLIEKGEADAESIAEYRPSVCNRLDRNTGGILLFAKTPAGAREMARLLRDRSIKKFYQAAVAGTVKKGGFIEGFLSKDEKANTVRFLAAQDSRQETIKAGAANAETASKTPPAIQHGTGAGWTLTTYRPMISGEKYSLLELELITGKTHQIRSHLSSIGHPVLGDPKYGDQTLNKKVRSEYGLRGQMLWCARIEFPEMDGQFADLSRRVIVCDPPALYRTICESRTDQGRKQYNNAPKRAQQKGDRDKKYL